MSVELVDSYESLLDRAVQQIALGKSQDAIDLALRVVNRLSKLSAETLTRKPGHRVILMNAWQMSVEFLRWEKRFGEAIALCEQLIASHPGFDEISIRINLLRIEQGKIDEGLADLCQTVERIDGAYGWTILGIQLNELGHSDRAEACFRKALARAESNEASAEAYEELVTLYKSQHRVVEALEAWNMAVVLQPEQVENSHILYRWLIQEGEIERAQSFLRRERNLVWMEFYSGLIAWRVEQPDRACRHWRAALDVKIGEDDPALIEWLEAAVRLGETSTALAEVEHRMSHGDPLPPFALMMSALAYAINGDMLLAHEAMHTVVQTLERRWPSRARIEGWWPLVTTVISNPETLLALAGYFEQGEA
ncbi:MAG: hypothetical protein JXA89_10830 [Anaerolineae bacterium]|nr:hypothetical protein [Anaerolineae bacterium]